MSGSANRAAGRAALTLRQKLYLGIFPAVLSSLALMSKCTADRESALRYQNEASLILVETLDGIEKLLDDPFRDLLTLSRAADFHDAIFWERSRLEAEATERSGDLQRFLANFRAKAPQYRAVAYLTARRASVAEPWSVSVLKCVPSPPCGEGTDYVRGLAATGTRLLGASNEGDLGRETPPEVTAEGVRYATVVDTGEPDVEASEIGVLVLDLGRDAIAAELARARRDAPMRVTLADAAGAPVVTSAGGDQDPNADWPREMRGALGGGDGALASRLAPAHAGSAVRVGNVDGRVVALTVPALEPRRIRALGWSLVLVTPPSRGRFATSLFPGDIYVLTAALTVVVSAACLWGLGWATRPLSDLAEAMSRAGEGDLKAEVAEGPADEIGRVARAFNEMVQALRSSRAQLASQLEESIRLRTTLENVIESTPAAVMVVDRQGQVLQWNEAAERQTGQSRRTMLGADLFARVPELAAHREVFERVLAEGRPVRGAREVYELASGEKGIRRVSLFPVLGTSGEAGGVVLSSEDVTSEEQIERMMVHAEKMAMIGRLAANMAHEIKNPLAGILWNLHNLERRLHPSSPVARTRMQEAGLDGEVIERFQQFLDSQKIPHYVSVIRECGLRADGIVKTLGDFSARGEKHVDADPRALIENTLLLARAAFDLEKRHDFRDIDLSVEVVGEVSRIRCNTQRIEQVLLNLVNNAAQALFARRQAEPTFEPRLRCRVRCGEEHVRIEVEDNGPGIPEAAREHIFEPFYTTKDIGEGTGLGLSISYLIVTEGHSGRMWVEDGVTGGARFVIELPAREAA